MPDAVAPRPAGRWVLINGSPRADGYIARMTQTFLQACGQPEVYRVDCFARPILPCDDCRYCHTHAGCAKRDMDEIYRRIEQADRLVFVSPVYHGGFPAPMKALIDRLQCYWAARFVRGESPAAFPPKQAVLLSAGGAPGDAGGKALAEQLRPPLTVLHAALAGTVHLADTDRRPFSAGDEAAVIRLAKQFLFQNNIL